MIFHKQTFSERIQQLQIISPERTKILKNIKKFTTERCTYHNTTYRITKRIIRYSKKLNDQSHSPGENIMQTASVWLGSSFPQVPWDPVVGYGVPSFWRNLNTPSCNNLLSQANFKLHWISFLLMFTSRNV